MPPGGVESLRARRDWSVDGVPVAPLGSHLVFVRVQQSVALDNNRSPLTAGVGTETSPLWWTNAAVCHLKHLLKPC